MNKPIVSDVVVFYPAEDKALKDPRASIVIKVLDADKGTVSLQSYKPRGDGQQFLPKVEYSETPKASHWSFPKRDA
jgi:hypothetical protein